jgi:tRNA-uridine 2-sulfurtransferase
MQRVVIGMSGGVDSSVAAYLLKEQGYEVIGMFMRNWHDESVTLSDECPWIDDSNDAMAVAEMLGIPFQVIDLSKEYKERIVDYMFDEYSSGRTPNPDVLCNREIKFDVFLKAAMKLNADFVATGHYCRKEVIHHEGREIHRLLAGKDPNKDQSYFLCQITQEQLSKILFPIGDLLKPEVRKIADEIGLPNAKKKDSQGLCFVGKVHLPDFLKQKLEPKEGLAIEIPADHPLFKEEKVGLEEQCSPFEFKPEYGKVVGKHQGAHFYTVGQRKGMGIGGTPLPLFVLERDVESNLLYVGQGENHPGLYRQGLKIQSGTENWIREEFRLKDGEDRTFLCRIRYRQTLAQATLHCKEEGLYITFLEPQRGVASGQFAAWYLEDELIGSGVIS